MVIGHHMHGLQVLFSMVPQPALQSHKGLRGRETTAREKGGGDGREGEEGRHTEREGGWWLVSQTERDRQRQAETERDRQRQTETNTDRPRPRQRPRQRDQLLLMCLLKDTGNY